MENEFCVVIRKKKYISCVHEGCKKHPNYNIIGEKKSLYCTVHKTDGMVDVKNTTCIYEGCKKRPLYNVAGLTHGLYCSKHKLENMIDIKNKTCIYELCKKQPFFNKIGENIGLYCAVHKTDGMVNVINKKCIHPGCKVRPSYNNEGAKKSLYCAVHKLENMVNVKDKKCIHVGCNKLPIYNIENEKVALYCMTHKSKNMIDIKNKTCKSDWCFTQVQKKYDGYCQYCFINLFPDDNRSKKIYAHTKEIMVRNTINSNFEGFIHDTPLYTGGCDCTHRRRIDHRKLIGNTILAIETDEFGHRGYDKTDEEIRYDDLYMIHSGKWVFIRFNPDTNVSKIDIDDKLLKLIDTMEECIDIIERGENTELVEIIKLYC